MIKFNFQLHSPNYSVLAASHINSEKKVTSWARLNQCSVPQFKVNKTIYVRDAQIGNYRAYKVIYYRI